MRLCRFEVKSTDVIHPAGRCERMNFAVRILSIVSVLRIAGPLRKTKKGQAKPPVPELFYMVTRETS